MDFFNLGAFFRKIFLKIGFWKNVSKSGRYFSFFVFISQIFAKAKICENFGDKADFEIFSKSSFDCPFWRFLGPFGAKMAGSRAVAW